MSSESSTSSLTPGEQARLRREKRERRILSQGETRLERIAKLQGGAAAREALHPDPPEADISEFEEKQSSTTTSSSIARRQSPSSPRRDVYGVDGGNDDPFNMLRGGNDPLANVPEELRDDPLLRLLLKNPLFREAIPGSSGAGARGSAPPERDSSAEDLTALAEKITRQVRGEMTGEQQPQDQNQVGPDPSTLKWKLVRMIGIITILGFLWTQLEDFHFSRSVDSSYGLPIFYTFIAFSLSLQALRLILDQGRPLPGSIIASIGSMLPHPFGTALISFARYRMILTDVLEDFGALIVGLAIMYYSKTR